MTVWVEPHSVFEPQSWAQSLLVAHCRMSCSPKICAAGRDREALLCLESEAAAKDLSSLMCCQA